MLEFKELCLDDKEAYMDFSERFKRESPEDAENFFLNPENFSFIDFYSLVRSLSKKSTLPEGWVRTRFYLVKEDGIIVGMGNIRYDDSDFILNYAGHIGYSVAPWERKKGYGYEILKNLLPLAKDLGMGKVLLTCDIDNLSSKKIIEKNNGILDRTFGEKEFYWIKL